MSKNVLVIGGAGQLGRAIYDYVFGNEITDKYFFTDINDDDINIRLNALDTDDIALFCKENKIDVIVNCAAYTNVAKAEEDYVNCKKLNVGIPQSIGEVANELNIKVIHISSDYVYDGNLNRPYDETYTEINSPINGVYGTSKFEGELSLRYAMNNKNFIILRTSWLYYKGHTSFPAKISYKLADGKPFTVVMDQVGTPTYAGDLASAIVRIIEINDFFDEICGVYNFSNMGVCSWFDFAKEVERLLYPNKQSIINPVCLGEDPIRPTYSVMNKNKFCKTFPYIYIPYWSESLKQFVSMKS